MRSLPPVAPDLGSWHQVLLHRDCHVKFDYVLYSAPFTLVGQTLWLRVTDMSISIFQDYRLVASHVRSRRPGIGARCLIICRRRRGHSSPKIGSGACNKHALWARHVLSSSSSYSAITSSNGCAALRVCSSAQRRSAPHVSRRPAGVHSRTQAPRIARLSPFSSADSIGCRWRVLHATTRMSTAATLVSLAMPERSSTRRRTPGTKTSCPSRSLLLFPIHPFCLE